MRYDGDDPYLVVAADKGTATFSDIANAISPEYGFWLGDAFASGGSAGYDHKAMGITARGAWESRASATSASSASTSQNDDSPSSASATCRATSSATACCCRGTSGWSRPSTTGTSSSTPIPTRRISFAERARLFDLPRSSLGRLRRGADLAPAAASSPARRRRSRSSPEVRARLGSTADERSRPDELIRAILRAPVDLLWNGGIGTYVKASHGDPRRRRRQGATTRCASTAAELRCRVVGEGGNLGFTQRGRIEYALAGGRINTDAIDNSAGVDCSDHEVNIKILLDAWSPTATSRASSATRCSWR